ncbi:GAF domain-containing sensor histidine kinase [Dactylosporangium sp. CS-033363]|uniref:sensor histidine kinase n=1 Tax=Dactylosporangium sp. CS-033363 TaxID=3239935 RepID=UPI003D933ABA
MARVLAVATGSAAALLVAGGAVLGFHLGNLHNGLLAVSFTAVGLYVVRRLPGHREGWLFAATGLAHAVMYSGRQYGLHAPALPGAAWAGWIGVWPLPLVLVLVGVTIMGFPDGRLPGRIWRPIVGGLAVCAVILAGVSALWPVEYTRIGLNSHPLDLPGRAVAESLYTVGRAVLYPAIQLVWAVCVVLRLRRARGDEARQLRGFVAVVALTALGMVIGFAGWQTPVPGTLLAALVPVAAGAAILRYRLYDLDPVINKALVFGVLAGLVTAGYAAIAVGIGTVLSGSRTVLALLAVAVVAVAFEPVRRWAQRWADRLVYGHRATPYESLARMSASSSAAALCATIAEAVGAREVVLLPPDAGPGVPIVHNGQTLGVLAVHKADHLTAAERRLVADLAAQAGLILALQASAQRLVAAGDEARRRLERDLHDGAQQRLVTVGLELGGLIRLATDHPGLAARAEAVRAELLRATAELRETARGIHPAVLTQDGLEAALEFLADRSAVPVRVRVRVDRRPPAEVESTAYFLVSEALTNAAKHSGATLVEVCCTLSADGLALSVCDNGAGGAAVAPGGGLEGLADRLTMLGARLTVDSTPAGTTLRTVIPCA